MTKKNPKILKMKQSDGKRLEKQPTRIERIERAVRELAALPQFLLQRFQQVLKTVEDVRFTFEVYGQILQEKGIITQEEVTAKGKCLIEERKKEKEEQLEKMKKLQEEKPKTEENENDILKSEVAANLMKSNIELQKTQVQDTDVSIKDI